MTNGVFIGDSSIKLFVPNPQSSFARCISNVLVEWLSIWLMTLNNVISILQRQSNRFEFRATQVIDLFTDSRPPLPCQLYMAMSPNLVMILLSGFSEMRWILACVIWPQKERSCSKHFPSVSWKFNILVMFQLLWDAVLKLPDWCWGSSIKRDAQASTDQMTKVIELPFQHAQQHMVDTFFVCLQIGRRT